MELPLTIKDDTLGVVRLVDSGFSPVRVGWFDGSRVGSEIGALVITEPSTAEEGVPVSTGPVTTGLSPVVTGSVEGTGVGSSVGVEGLALSPPMPMQVENNGHEVSKRSFWKLGALLTSPALRLTLIPTFASRPTPIVFWVPQTP